MKNIIKALPKALEHALYIALFSTFVGACFGYGLTMGFHLYATVQGVL